MNTIYETNYYLKEDFKMINSLLVASTLKSFEDLLKANDIPYEVEDTEAFRYYKKIWDESDKQALFLRQARPAVERIASKEPYLFEKGGAPLQIRFNDRHRKLKKDSFGEILLEREDLDWRVSLSVKRDANVIATMPVADRDIAVYMDKVVNVFNEIDDFGDRIFSVPCSNEYFDEVNDILQKIVPLDKDTWARLLSDEKFAYDSLITPMLDAIGHEIPRICADHPEAPQRLIEYFYGKIDYYYINPIDAVGVTRIGAVNSHGDLGRIPGTHNFNTPQVKFPTKLLDVRFANGRHGELSKDTIQFSFDGGWSVCITLRTNNTKDGGLNFVISVYLPVTPFGSYRDQVEWDPEA